MNSESLLTGCKCVLRLTQKSTASQQGDEGCTISSLDKGCGDSTDEENDIGIFGLILSEMELRDMNSADDKTVDEFNNAQDSR
jgi:hypothetical protein